MEQKFRKRTLPAYLNFLRAKYEAYTGAVDVASKPYYAMVDPCDICQLRCPTCPTGIENEGRKSKTPGAETEYRASRGRLTLELFDAFLEEMGEYLFSIDFHSWGEPLLNELTPVFIARARAYGIQTGIHTNLSLKLSDARIEELLSAGLDSLIASVDGFNQQAYQRFRVGGDVELVKKNLVRAARARDRLGLDTAIVYKYLMFSWNEHEVEDARRFCGDHGIIFLPNDACVRDPEWLPSHRQGEEPVISLLDVEELDRQWTKAGHAGYWREHEKQPFYLPVHPEQHWIPTGGPKLDSFCGWHYSVAVVQPSGQVAPCCIVEKDDDRFGAIVPGEVSLAQVWNNEKFRKSRAAFSGDSPAGLEAVDTICTRCYFPDDFKHTYSANDGKVVAQFLDVYGDTEPALATAFRMLAEGEGAATRNNFVACYESELIDIPGDYTGKVPSGMPVELTEVEEGQCESMDLDAAVVICRDYMNELGFIGVNGQAVHDVSLLPAPKPAIMQALHLLIGSATGQEMRSSLQDGYVILAFFQPGVGDTPVNLDEFGPGQESWREITGNEMRQLLQALS